MRPIAEGGMGMIYEVEQVATGARRALKVMHGRFAGDDGLRTRFVREARLTAAIPTDHVAHVVDAGVDADSGALFIVMELLEGCTLSQELRNRTLFDWGEGLAILAQVAHALGAAHALGIVHRDLKPANVFLARARRVGTPFDVKLLDFGIAKAVAGVSESTSVILGTPTWMAPEQASVDAPIGPEADVWSLGLLAFLMLTGQHYFASANSKGVTTAAVLREVILDPLMSASDRAAEIGVADRLPEGFNAWFARCVDRAPNRRFPDARAAFDALSELPPPSPSKTPSQEHLRARGLRVNTPTTAIETPAPRRALRGSIPATSAATGNATASQATQATPVSRRIAAATGLAAAAAIAFFFWSNRQAAPPAPVAAPATLPPVPSPVRPEIRLHGSNTIGAELVPAMAQAFLQRRTTAKNVLVKRTASDEISVEARDDDRVLESVEVFAHGSSTAFDDLRSGRCDLGMASRRIHDDEVGALSFLGNLASAASEYVIAVDGIAVIVNPSNPVSVLTRKQIGDLFSGHIQRWSEVGGIDEPVVVHARDDKSGTYDTFKHLALGASALVTGARRHESSDELSDAVAGDARAVGFIGLPYVRSAKAVMVQEVGSAPMLASEMTVSTEDYPLARRLYLYVPAAASQVTRDFVDFALSADGQKLVRAAGFADLEPQCAAAPPPPTSPRDYRDAVQGACRVSIDFRFEQAAMQLDTRALRDLTRIATLMGQAEHRGQGLVLLGFSDTSGVHADDVRLSQQRAGIVAQQLRARGLNVSVERGLGAEMLVGDDTTDDGRARNRRVEVWLR
ncbi:MAG TPA: substrate-binding domain-containing protein [Polyangiaceae bacterium]|nr:substrate-binding domain-containing protein [Polyangiaceae bacterium]